MEYPFKGQLLFPKFNVSMKFSNYMTLLYFKDTDKLLINFNKREIHETKDISENVLLELDKSGNVVSMTIEHATKQAEITNFSFSQVSALSA